MLFFFSVSDRTRHILDATQSVTEILSKVKSSLGQHVATELMMIETQIINIQLRSTETLLDYLYRAEDSSQQLQKLDSKDCISDSKIAQYVLNGLPNRPPFISEKTLRKRC